MQKKSLAAAALALTALTGAVQADDNAMTILINRISDDINPSVNYYMSFDIYLPSELPMAQVGVSLPNGAQLELETDDDDPGIWYAELEYTDFNVLKTAANGAWTVTILGSGLYSSTFTLNLAGFTEADLYPSPEVTSPSSGQTNVANDVTVTWNDTSGGQADLLIVESDANGEAELEQGVLSIDGEIAVSATSWTPPLNLLDGMNEIAIGYFDIDQTRVTPFFNIVGSLAWGAPPFNAPLIPGMPALILGGETIIEFEVGEEEEPPACTGDLDEDGEVAFSDLLSVLSNWGCTECAHLDADESGTVDFGDLLAVLAAWGPCDV